MMGCLLSMLYGLGTRARNALYDRGILRVHRVGVPVLSVGNLTAGGSGKTPLVLALVDQVRLLGWSPVVLSRGYGGTLRGPHLVQARDRPELVGDEPLMMARRDRCPVVIARDRVLGARWIVQQQLGTVIVLDDGFQHRRLYRDLDVVSVDVSSTDSGRAFLAGRLLPVGRFREARDRALQRVDLVILNHRQPQQAIDDCTLAHVRAHCRDHEVLEAFCEAESPRLLGNGTVVPTGPVWAFCAIANPEPFFRTLEGLGYGIKRRFTFPDHHTLSRAERQEILQTELPVICTEKDAVKLERSEVPSVAVMRVQARMEPTGPLHAALHARLRSGQPQPRVVP